jgi:hypothetical protein
MIFFLKNSINIAESVGTPPLAGVPENIIAHFGI